jgi:hypothetical protein
MFSNNSTVNADSVIAKMGMEGQAMISMQAGPIAEFVKRQGRRDGFSGSRKKDCNDPTDRIDRKDIEGDEAASDKYYAEGDDDAVIEGCVQC